MGGLSYIEGGGVRSSRMVERRGWGVEKVYLRVPGRVLVTKTCF